MTKLVWYLRLCNELKVWPVRPAWGTRQVLVQHHLSLNIPQCLTATLSACSSIPPGLGSPYVLLETVRLIAPSRIARM